MSGISGLRGGSSIGRHKRHIYLAIGFLALIASGVAVTESLAGSPRDMSGPAPAINWSRTYDLPGYGQAEAMWWTQGGFVVTGAAGNRTGDKDVLLMKMSDNGDLQWSRTYGPGEGRSVTDIGGYAIAGTTGPSADNYTDICLIKTDWDGNTLWTRTFGGKGPDQGNALTVAGSDLVLVGTVYNSTDGGYDGFLAIVIANGTQRGWTMTYRDYGALSESFEAVHYNGEGYVIAGTMIPRDYGPSKLILVMISSSRYTLLNRSYDIVSPVSVGAVRQTRDRGFIVAGTTGNYTMFLLRTDHDGNVLWYKEYDSFSRLTSGTVEEMPDGGFITGGARLVRTDKNGNVLWSELTDEGFTSWRTAVLWNSDGSFTVAGGAGAGGLKPIMARTMPDGRAVVTATPTARPVPTPPLIPVSTDEPIPTPPLIPVMP